VVITRMFLRLIIRQLPRKSSVKRPSVPYVRRERYAEVAYLNDATKPGSSKAKEQAVVLRRMFSLSFETGVRV